MFSIKLQYLVLISTFYSISSFAQVPMSVCSINLFPIDGLEIVSVGTVTGIIDSDTFILSSEGCEVQCDGELNEMPLPGFEIYILGVIEYESLGNDLEIDTDYWVLIDTGQPDEDPPPIVFTVEDAISSPFGTVALLSGDVTEIIDEVDGFSSFSDLTGSMDMDFKSDDIPDLDEPIHALGVVEPGDGAPSYIDVFYWYYEGGEPPTDPDPIGWNIGQVDSLSLGSFFFIYGAVSNWANEAEGEGEFEDEDNTMNLTFSDSVDVLPELSDSIYILGFTFGDSLNINMLVFKWYEDFAVGIEENLALNSDIRIYPNPVDEFLYIDSESKFSRIVLYTIEGKKVIDVNQIDSSPIDVSKLKPGTYLVSIFNGNEYLGTKKLMIN